MKLFMITLSMITGVIGNVIIKNTDIVTIATGGYSAHSLVKSLRRKGRWKSDIYVVSDNCTTPTRDTLNIQVSKTSTPLESKVYKMDILKYTSKDYVLFLDSDIEVVNNLNYFFSSVSVWNSKCQVYLGYDMWYSNKFTYNSGIILVKRNHSEQFLQLWKNTIEAQSYLGQKDQPGLKEIIDNRQVSVCSLPQETIQYLPDASGYLRNPQVIFRHAMRLKRNKHSC